jgi:ribosomal protein S18 acetylase RimI-like enzyme
MNKELVIREIRKREETKVCQLVIECFNEFVAPDYGEEGVNEFLKYVNPDLMQERLERGNFAFVAVVDDLVTGAIEVRSNNHISLLFVKKEYQGRGIARELLELAIERCRQADNMIDEFDANSSPYAVKVYERLGFTRVDDAKLVNGIRFIPMKLKLVRFPK